MNSVREQVFQKAQQVYYSRMLLRGLIGIGIMLHLSQYLFNRSLWVDEATVAMRIINSSYIDFWQPSETPIGFLVVEKLLVQMFGESEYVLRFIPFLSGICAIFLFLKFTREYLSPQTIPIALGLFVTSNKLIYYSSSLKQYSSDVFITLILYIIARSFLIKPLNIQRVIGFGLVGAMLLWFSHPAIFILAGLGGYIISTQILRKQWMAFWMFAATGSFWLGSFGVLYMLTFRVATHTEAAQQYWAGHFMPLPPLSFVDIFWFVRTFFEIIEYTFNFPQSIFVILKILQDVGASILGVTPSLGLPLTDLIQLTLSHLSLILRLLVTSCVLLVGTGSILTKNREYFFWLTAPIIFTLFASGLHKYPFAAERVILFIIPILFLFSAEGVAWIRARSRVKAPIIGFIVIGIFGLPLLYLANYHLIHPRTHEETRPVLQYLQTHWQQDDILYVYYASQTVFEYYSRQLDLKMTNTIQGIASRSDWNKYIQDLQQLRGHKRTWIFLSHAYSEEAFFLAYLDQIGKKLDSFKAERASVYLYDLR
jgi:hypothetical protein